MSNQCSNLFNCRSFSLRIPFRTPLKPYSTTVRPIFSFHSNLVLTLRRSRSRSSSFPPPLAAQSSSDIVLIATTEHLDGSLVFQFGDASEVVKNDDIVKELGSQDEQDSDVLNVSKGDQERQVIGKTVERGYEKSGRVTEAADGIWNADLDGDIAEKEANVISDLKDCQAEVSDGLSDISVEEATSSPSDAEMNHSVEGVESIDRTECSTELDGDESSNTNISVLDNAPNSDKSAYSEGTQVKDGRDETNDPSLSVKLESRQVSQNEVMDVRKPYAEDDLDQVEAEDTVRSDTKDLMNPTTHVNMSTSDVELTDAANENVEENFQDITINKDTLIDEMPPSYLLGAESTLDEVRELQSENLKVEVTMDVSSTKAMNLKDQDMEDKLHPVNTNNRDESDVAYVMPVSSVKEAEANVEEQVSDIVLQDTSGQNLNDEISQVGNEDEDSSVSVNLETMQVSHTEDTCEVEEQISDIVLQDTTVQNLNDGISQVGNEDEDSSVSVNLETMQVSHTEDTCEGDMKDLQSLATMHNSDEELMDTANENMEKGLQDMNISENTLLNILEAKAAEPTLDEVSQIQSSDFKLETTMEVSSTKSMDVIDQGIEDELQQMSTENKEKNVAFVKSDSLVEEPEEFVEEEISHPQSNPLELKRVMQVSDIEIQNTMGQNLIDDLLQVGNGKEDSLVSVKLQTTQVSHIEVMDVTQPYADDKLHKVENEDTSGSDSKILPPPATMHISDVEQTEAATKDMEEGLQDMNSSEGVLLEGMLLTNSLGVEQTLDEVSQLQSSNVDLETTMDFLTTGRMDIEDLAVDSELQQVSTDNRDADDVGNVTIAESDLEDEDKLHKVENEDTSGSDSKNLPPPATMHISDVEQTEAATKDMEEGLQDMNSSEGVLLEGMLLTNSLGVEQTLDEVSQLQSSNVDLETTTDFLTTGRMDIEDLAVVSELQQVSTDNRDADDVGNVTIAESDLEEVNPPHSTPVEIKPSLQASNIEVPDATCQNLDDEILQIIDEREHYNMLENCAETDALESLIQLKQAAHDPLLETEKTEGKASSSEFNEALEDASLLASKAKVAREEIYLTGYFLSSGAALLEHQFKALTGGDDAYFVAGSKWLGVANGVSQWSFEGSGPGTYAQELMRTCEEIALDTSSSPMTNPVELICRGVKETNISGSSNILIASFDGQALHVANIGDTGFLVLRHGAIYKKSSPLLHDFHFALQVEDSDDPLQLVEEYRIELDEGDIVVSATDGLFDNLYEREIAMIVSKSLQAGIKPQEIANLLATRAQEVGRSAYVRSPFSDAAQAAGYTGYAGGKPDNVAVIVSLVEK